MSKTVKFEIGDKVLLIIDNELCKGTIERLHEYLPRPVAIVTLDDGRTQKAYITDIIPEFNVAKEPEKVQEEKTELQDGAKVITKDQFIEAVHHVTSPEGMLGDKVGEVDPMNAMIKGMAVFIVGMKISEKLFQDKEEIAITKDQLKEVIKENSDPAEIAKSTDGKMSISQVLPISMLSMLLLHKLIDILFDDSKND